MGVIATFKAYPRTRTLKIEPVSHVIAQMQGLLDTDPDPENETETAFRGLVESWYAMLRSAVVDEAKRVTHG